MYRIDALRDQAQVQGGRSVSRRQIEEWHRDGLLPAAQRPATPGRRGRGPLLFPECAVGPVVTLSRWRYHMGDAWKAKFWLWLEGYDYIEIDVDKVWAVLTGFIRDMWMALQDGEISALPDMPQAPRAPVPAGTYEAVLDALYRVVGQSVIDAHQSTHTCHAAVAGAAALLGMPLSELWNSDVSPATDDLATHPVVQALLAANRLTLPDLAPGIAQPITVPQVFNAMQLPRIARKQPDWEAVRLMWRTLCVVTDHPCPAAEVAPFVDWLRAVRASLYKGRIDLVLVGIIAMSGVVSGETLRLHARAMLNNYKVGPKPC